MLMGFHGYGENASIHMEELQKIAGIDDWSLVAVQALHPFYSRTQGIAASWMTVQDREYHIDDNIDYVRRVAGSLPRPETLVFLGFSQGVAMAYRAAADFAWRCHGLIILGGDIAPDVEEREDLQLPPVLLARGKRDEWYSDEKFKEDLKFLKRAARVETLVFEGSHEWTPEFREAAGNFLRRISD